MQVKGTQYRHDDARRFVDVAAQADNTSQPPAVTLRREPDNPHDPCAIMVWAQIGADVAMIGYVPADTAARIFVTFPRDMPLCARLNRISVARDKFAIWIDVMRPSKRSEWWKREMAGR